MASGSFSFVLVLCINALSTLNLVQCATFIPILQQEKEVYPDGSYKYSYATANGIMAVEQGKLEHPGTPEEGQAVEGTYTYLNQDGTLVNVRYFAGRGGFRAVPNVVHRPSARTQGPAIFNNVQELQRSLRP